MNKIIIEKDRLLYNINAIKEQAGKMMAENQKAPVIIAVLKANAYGMSTKILAKELISNGIDFFAVTDVYEALSLREYAPTQNILVLNSTCIEDEVKIIVQNDLIASCGSFESIDMLEKVSLELGKTSKFHMNIDTGMSRFGFRADEIINSPLDLSDEEKKNLLIHLIIDKLNTLQNAKLEGIYTHFQQSYEKDSARTKMQYDLFLNVLNKFRENNVDVGLRHCCNTSAFFKYPYMHLDAVRVGSAFSGRAQLEVAKKLKRVGYLESEICEIREIKKGDKVFYSGMYTASSDMKVGVVEAGFADGFGVDGYSDNITVMHKLRKIKHILLSMFKDTNNYVEINGKKSKVLGRIGMKNFVCDLSNIDANPGEKVKINVSLALCDTNIIRELR